MNFNSLFFPAPSKHYSVTSHFGEMIYIPKDFTMVDDPLTGEPQPRLNIDKLRQASLLTDSSHKKSKTERDKRRQQLSSALAGGAGASSLLNRDSLETTDPALLLNLTAGLPRESHKTQQSLNEADMPYASPLLSKNMKSLGAIRDNFLPNSKAESEYHRLGSEQKPPRVGVPAAHISRKMTLKSIESFDGGSDNGGPFIGGQEGGTDEEMDTVMLVDGVGFSGNPEDIDPNSPILISDQVDSQIANNYRSSRPQKPSAIESLNPRQLTIEEDEVNHVAESEIEESKQETEAELKHIPCLLIEKRVRTKAAKRESSVVNLLRSHMADLAKTYQLHQANKDMPAPTGTNLEVSPAKVNMVSDEGSRQRANNEASDGASHDKSKPTKIIVYFHGNAEDVGVSYELLLKMSITFNCSVLAVEYPGYGIYRTEQADAETLMINAKLVMQYLTGVQGYSQKDIILVGRSMGSGPACALAVEYAQVAALVLLSPYTSLKQAVKTLLGTLASLIVRERFENHKLIQRVKCPTLIIHGQADELIPESHAIDLHTNCGGPSKLIMPAGMTHNECDLKKDIVQPIEQFFLESNVVPKLTEGRIRKFGHALIAPPVEILALATHSDQEQTKQLLLQKKAACKNNGGKEDGNEDVRRVKLQGPGTIKMRDESAMRSRQVDPASIDAAYSTATFHKPAQQNMTMQDEMHSASQGHLFQGQPLIQESHSLLDKSLKQAQAQLAASAEYKAVFRGRVPGPRHSLGVGPSPGPRPRAQATPQEGNSLILPKRSSVFQQSQPATSLIDNTQVKRVRTISTIASSKTRILRDQKSFHRKTNSHHSSFIAQRLPIEGVANQNMSTLLDQSLEEFKDKRPVSKGKSNRGKRQRLQANQAAYHFQKRKEADYNAGGLMKLQGGSRRGEGFCKKGSATPCVLKSNPKPVQQALLSLSPTTTNTNTNTQTKAKSIVAKGKGKAQANKAKPEEAAATQLDPQHPYSLMTPEQNMRKHINSPNLMIPNKIGKPLSWYNELEALLQDEQTMTAEQLQREQCSAAVQARANQLAEVTQVYLGDSGALTTPKDESETLIALPCEEADMKGIEENVGAKADAMHEARGRVRTSSQVHVFAHKELVIKKVHTLNNTEDLRRVLAFTESLDSRHKAAAKAAAKDDKVLSSEEGAESEKGDLLLDLQQQPSDENNYRSRIMTKSSECVSLPTEQAPNFVGWQNLEVNHNHSLQKDAKYRKRNTMKNKLLSGAQTSKAKDQTATSSTLFSQIQSKDFAQRIQTIQTPKKPGQFNAKKKHTVVPASSLIGRTANQNSFAVQGQQVVTAKRVYDTLPQSRLVVDDNKVQTCRPTASSGNLLAGHYHHSKVKPLHQMRQSQRGSKVQILEQGGVSSGAPSSQVASDVKRQTTQTYTHQQKRVSQFQSSLNQGDLQLCMLASSVKIGPDKKFKKLSELAAGVNPDDSLCVTQTQPKRQKSQNVRPVHTTRAKPKEMTRKVDKERASNSSIALLSTSQVVNGKSLGQHHQDPLNKSSQSSNAAVKLVTIPQALTSKNHQSTFAAASKQKAISVSAVGSNSQSHKLNNSQRVSVGEQALLLKDSFSSGHQQAAFAIKISAVRSVAKTGGVGKAAKTCKRVTESSVSLGGKGMPMSTKSRHAVIKLSAQGPFNKDLSMSHVLLSQKVASGANQRPLSKSSIRGGDTKTARSGTFAPNSGLTTPQNQQLARKQVLFN